MNLIIFPGGGSPDDSRYHSVYELIVRRTKDYGYTKVDTSLRYPGHALTNGKDPGTRTTLNGALESAHHKVQEYENKGMEYHILGRSLGTIVAATLCSKTPLNGLRKLILWGIPPYWLSYKYCVIELDSFAELARTKGWFIDETYFPSLLPVEMLLRDIQHPTIIATGEKDKYSPPAFFEYLKWCGQGNDKLEFRGPVKGAPHEVITDEQPENLVMAYLETLFA